MNHDYYYHVEADLAAYPKADIFIIIGGRNTGKTYSALKDCYLNERKFVFIKRTMEDVDLLCSGMNITRSAGEYIPDLSPFAPINRDLHCNVRAVKIRNGLGAFYHCDEENEPAGAPIGFLIAMTAVTKFKGFDMSEADWLIFDEFIPQPWERVNRKEGEQLLDLYKTVARDREHRGRDPLKLICLANATSITNPVMNIFEIVNDVARMNVSGEEYNYIKERGILIHMIKDNPDFLLKEKESTMFRAMGDTAWGSMAFDNQFGYNDFSAIGRMSVRKMKPVCSVSYKHDNYYIYVKDGQYYMTTTRHNSDRIYNLNQENDQKLFWVDYGIDLRNECIEGKMLFESYTMYDLIVNYKKIFIL